jgi:hypothetical protein
MNRNNDPRAQGSPQSSKHGPALEQAIMAENEQNLQQEPPWPSPARPDGAGRAEQEYAIGNAPRPGAEPLLPVRNELAARRRLVQLIARRAVQILAESNDEKQEGNLRDVQQP